MYNLKSILRIKSITSTNLKPPVLLKATHKELTNAFCDRGFRDRYEINNTKAHIPIILPASSSPSDKRKAKKDFGRRSALEPVIGHLKSDFRQEAPAAMARNFLKGSAGDAINLLMAATAFKLTKWMKAGNLVLFLLCNGFFGL